jgi:predicted transport protein
VFLNLKKGTLNDPKKMAIDVSEPGHWGNGDYLLKISDASDIGYFLTLIRQSFDLN